MLEYIYPAPGEMLYRVIYTTCCRKTYSDFNISLWLELYGIIYGTQGGGGGNFTPLVGTPVQPDGRVVHPSDVAHGP